MKEKQPDTFDVAATVGEAPEVHLPPESVVKGTQAAITLSYRNRFGIPVQRPDRHGPAAA